MKRIGLLTLVIGLVALAAALGMDTSVASGYGERVHNLGLMSEKQNYIFVSIALAIIGAILLAVGARTSKASLPLNPIDGSEGNRACPFCAEQIKNQAVVCRYCGRDVEPSMTGKAAAEISTASTRHIGQLSLQKSTPKTRRNLALAGGAIILIAIAFTGVRVLLAPPESLFYSLENMVVNLADPGGEKVAQIGVTLHAKDAKTIRTLKAFLPKIRGEIMLLLSQKTADELLTSEGKDALAKEIQVEVNRLPDAVVTDVMFQNFIVN